MADTEVRNFGNNVQFRPASHVCPKDEAELLGVLQHNRAGRVRVMGSKHAWSHGIETDGILLEMRHFTQIQIHERKGQPFVTVGAGCQIKTLLAALNARGLTTPSVGLITEQTIAVVTATPGFILKARWGWVRMGKMWVTTRADAQWHSLCNPKRQRGALTVYFHREFPR